MIDAYPQAAVAMRDAGWEFMGHGYVQTPMHHVADQPSMIRQALDAIEAFTGKRPVGWLGPGLTETWETPDILSEEGYDYVCDWCSMISRSG